MRYVKGSMNRPKNSLVYTWVESFERIITNLKVALRLLKPKRWMCELANIMISIFLEENGVFFYIDYRNAWDYTSL